MNINIYKIKNEILIINLYFINKINIIILVL